MSAPEQIAELSIPAQVSESPVSDPRIHKSPRAFGIGNFGISILAETFNGYAYFYYIDILGLAMGSAALVRTIFTLWDVADDPIMGLLSDRTRTRWGRRRPWLFTALPFMLIVFISLFSVPASFQAPSKLSLYMLIFMLLYETLNTILGINYSALFPELFQTLAERTRVAAYSQAGNVLAVLVGLVLAPLLFQSIGFTKMAVMYALIGGSFYFVALFFNREGIIPKNQHWSTLIPTMRSILVDHVFWLYALMMILTFFSTSLIPFALPFYVKYSLQARGEIISLLSGLAMLASLAGIPLWNRLLKTLSLGKVFLGAVCISGIGVLTMGLFPNLPCAVFSALVYGGALQGISVCNIIIRAGLVGRNIDRTHNRNEASYYGLMNSVLHLVGLLQSLAMVLVGAIFGYMSGDQPGAHPDLAFRFLISFLPVVSLSLAAIFARPFFKASTSLPISSFRHTMSPPAD